MGTMDKYTDPVLIDHLMGASFIEFSDDMVGIYIPQSELHKRTKYNWFIELSQKEIYNADIIIAKHMLIAVSQ